MSCKSRLLIVLLATSNLISWLVVYLGDSFCARSVVLPQGMVATKQVQQQQERTAVSSLPPLLLGGFQPKFHSKVQFVITVGLEGTGHHLMRSIIYGSPDLQQLQKWGVSPKGVQNALFRYRKLDSNVTTGLMVAHCPDIETKSNTENKLQEVVQELRDANQQVLDAVGNHDDNNKVIRFPLNIPGNKKSESAPGTGMISYPNFGKECRKVNYPNLDLLYDACNQARVDCGHVYIYRDPVEVLASTTLKRSYNKDALGGIHLYTTLLKVISTELHMHPERTMGCFGFFERDDMSNWFQGSRDLWGWDHEEYVSFLNETYRSPSKSGQNKLAKTKFTKSYMESFRRVHNHTLQKCLFNLGQPNRR